MGEIKISVSERLDEILQSLADDLGVKKAEFVKNLVIKELMGIEKGVKNKRRIKNENN